MNDIDITWEDLVAYVAGELDGPRRSDVEAALATDARLARQVARLRELLDTMEDDATVPPTDRALRLTRALAAQPLSERWTAWLDAATSIVARLVFDSHRPAARLGLRGDPHERHLAFESAVGRLDVRLSAPDPSRRQWRVRGQIPSLGPTSSALLTDERTRDVVASAALDGSGQFKLDADPGRYGLSIVVDHASRLVVDGLDLGGADTG